MINELLFPNKISTEEDLLILFNSLETFKFESLDPLRDLLDFYIKHRLGKVKESLKNFIKFRIKIENDLMKKRILVNFSKRVKI